MESNKIGGDNAPNQTTIMNSMLVTMQKMEADFSIIAAQLTLFNSCMEMIMDKKLRVDVTGEIKTRS